MYDILIVGGGISGLFLAYRLLQTNKDVKLLLIEKNARVGGRIFSFTHEDKESENLLLAAGAARFNDNHTHVLDLMQELGLELSAPPVPATIKFVDAQHKFAASRKYTSGFELVNKVVNMSEKYRPSYLKSLSFYDLAKECLKSDDEVHYLLVASGYSGQIRNMNAYDAIRLFTKGINPALAYYSNEFPRILNALQDQLNRLLLQNPGSQVKLQTEIVSVCRTEHHRAFSAACRTGERFEARKVIFALPQQALLKINLLRPVHSLLNSCVSSKSLCRVYAVYRPEDVWFRDMQEKVVTDNPLRYIIPVDKERGVIMISYTDAAYCKYWKNVSKNKQDLSDQVKKLIFQTFKVKTKTPLALYVFYWENGVAYWNKGYDSKVVSSYILNPMQNVFICGENYSLDQSWVNGALDTCKRCLRLVRDET